MVIGFKQSGNDDSRRTGNQRLLGRFWRFLGPDVLHLTALFSTLAAFSILSSASIHAATPSELRQYNDYTFKVLGIGNSRLQETRFDLRRGSHRLTVGAQYAKFNAASTLSSPFSDAVYDYAAGELINARIKKTWYEMNYLTTLAPQRLLERDLLMSLGAGVVILDFSYRMGSRREQTREKRSDMGFRLGGEMDWRLGQRLSLSSLAYVPIPVSNGPSILSLDLTASYELWRMHNSRWYVLAGAAYHQVDHPERLPIPDQIELMTGPLLKLGLAFSF
jgi:hypothetical protein